MKRAIYYDTETTGIKTDKDRIIEIAAFDPQKNQTFVQFINPGIPIPPDAIAIHKITDEMVANAPNFKEIGNAFANFCGEGAVLIAHNNDSFDKPFLEYEFKRSSLDFPTSWEYIDTLKWSRKYRPDLPKHTLQHLREIYQIPPNQAHRALDDVMILYRLFSLMIDDLPIEKVLKLLSEQPRVHRMPFGKHRGRPLSEIPKDYVKWLDESGALKKGENQLLKKSFVDLGLLT
ncbi:MAG: DUF3820 family protein [Chlamydiae bacterium]|nr:DUF3820 family protein [Chlamydiota bacterium]